MNQYPDCTIEPNIGTVELPDARMGQPDSKNTYRVRIRQFSEELVLVLPRGN